MAYLGNSIPTCISGDTLRCDRPARHRAARLCDIRNVLGLPGAGVTRMGNFPLSQCEIKSECLTYLTSILDPIVGEQASEFALNLITEFGTLSGVFSANAYSLHRVIGDCPKIVAFIRLLRDAGLHALRHDVATGPVLASSTALRDYLFAQMAHQSSEQFRVLYLNTGKMLIKDEIIASGTIDEVAAYPREIVRRALEVGANALILVHNHPSGDSTPSKSDITLTRAIVSSCHNLRIAIHDHIIVARGHQSSMRGLGLI